MKPSTIKLGLCLAPTIAWAHPGHFDGAPVAHAFSHALLYMMGAAALYLMAKQHGKQAWRALALRLRKD